MIQKEKWNGILYEGGFENFSVNGSCNMEDKVLYKNNPTIEAKKRLNMSYLLLKNPKMIEVIQKIMHAFFMVLMQMHLNIVHNIIRRI